MCMPYGCSLALNCIRINKQRDYLQYVYEDAVYELNSMVGLFSLDGYGLRMGCFFMH